MASQLNRDMHIKMACNCYCNFVYKYRKFDGIINLTAKIRLVFMMLDVEYKYTFGKVNKICLCLAQQKCFS